MKHFTEDSYKLAHIYSRFRWDYLDLYRERTGRELEGFNQFMAQVSCNWWRPGHVTSVLTSDWSRASRRSSSSQFSQRSHSQPGKPFKQVTTTTRDNRMWH